MRGHNKPTVVTVRAWPLHGACGHKALVYYESGPPIITRSYICEKEAPKKPEYVEHTVAGSDHSQGGDRRIEGYSMARARLGASVCISGAWSL